MSTALQTMEETQDLPQLFELARHLVPTGMLPEHLKTPGQVVAIILAGRELGMPPMRSLRSLTLVKGKVVESADSQLARFKTDGGKAKFVTLTEDEAVMDLVHPNGDEHTERFSMSDAKRAGLTSNQTWAKYPKAMLRSRVITAGLKSIGWDGAVGNYDPEEAKEIGPVAAPQPTIMQPRRLSERKPEPPQYIKELPVLDLTDAAKVAEVVDEADPALVDALMASIDEINAKANVAQVTNSYITEAQRKRLFAIAKEAGHKHDDFKAYLNKRYAVSSTKEITQNIYDELSDRLHSSSPLV